jgi:hypothetical protein
MDSRRDLNRKREGGSWGKLTGSRERMKRANKLEIESEVEERGKRGTGWSELSSITFTLLEVNVTYTNYSRRHG